MAIENHEGTIVVTGEDVRPVAELIRLRGWKLAADMRVKFGMSSAMYPSVKAFRAEYDVKARNWAEVQRITAAVLADIRTEMRGQ